MSISQSKYVQTNSLLLVPSIEAYLMILVVAALGGPLEAESVWLALMGSLQLFLLWPN